MPEFRIVPNPASEAVRLYINGEATGHRLELHLISSQGKILKRQFLEDGIRSVEWSTQELPAGLYQVVLRTETGEISTQSMIIIH